MPYEPSGVIAGLLYAEDFKLKSDVQKADLANKQFDLQSKQLAEIAQRDMTEELKAASARVKSLPPEEQALEMASIAANNGKLGEASELLKTSAAAFKDRVTGEKALLENSITGANTASAMLENINDQSSLDAMAQRVQLQGIDTQGFIPMLQKMSHDFGWDDPRTQQLLHAGKQALVSKKDQAAIELDKLRGKSEQALADLRHAQARLVPSQIEANRALATQRLKTGDKGTEYSAADRALASNLLGSRYDTAENPAMLGLKADTILERAKDYLPLMSKKEAINKAYTELDKEHEFVGMTVREQTMGTLERPTQIPIGKSGKINADALQINEVYEGVGKFQGKWVWNGSGFEPLGGQE